MAFLHFGRSRVARRVPGTWIEMFEQTTKRGESAAESFPTRNAPRPSAGTAFQSSAFSPTLFCGGEGGRRPDEGAFEVGHTPAATRKLAQTSRRWLKIAQVSNPPSSAFGTFSPRKARGGEKAL